MFAAMCNHGVRVKMILLHGEHPPAGEMPEGFEQLCVPHNTNILTRRKYIRKHLIPADDGEPTIVHDTFMAQMGLYLRNRWTLRKHKNVRNVLGLYFTTPAYFLKGQWRGKSEDAKTRLREWPFYMRRHIPVIFGELVSCHLSDMITGNSEEVVEGVRKYYRIPSARTKFISAEIDTDFYCPGPSKRKELNLPLDKKRVLYAGHFQRHKGIDTLLEAFEILTQKDKDVRLILLGDLADTGYVWFKNIMMGMSSASQIDVRDRVDSHTLRDYYRSCDVFVCPTHHEGSPRVIKEAIACGCPVITSRISGNYAIDPEGKSLVYATNWDPQEYAGLMSEVLNNPEFRQQRIGAGLEVISRLSLKATSQKYMELYKSLF